MANTTVACTNINLLKESQIPATPSQNEVYAVELAGKPATEEQLTSKANTSADNFTSIGKRTVVGWGMPDYSAGVSLSDSQTYTPQVDGIFIITASGAWALAAVYVGTSTSGIEIGLNRANSNDNNGKASVTAFANSGETYYIRATPSVSNATFYPFKGET